MVEFVGTAYEIMEDTVAYFLCIMANVFNNEYYLVQFVQILLRHVWILYYLLYDNYYYSFDVVW